MIPDDYTYLDIALHIAGQRRHADQFAADAALDLLLSDDAAENVQGLMIAAQLKCFAPA